jgi:hypothetical protein
MRPSVARIISNADRVSMGKPTRLTAVRDGAA